ncbi:MAG: DJ-1/PfpI family protein [Clostridia bacterium]|nr:DJ-1/PfpI family protein [Clostridia bacterium]
MVYVFLANGFEETEAIAPIDIMRRAGIDVELIAIGDELCVMGSHGMSITADKRIKDICVMDREPEMMVLPGGMPGTKNLLACAPLCAMLTYANGKDIPIAAICAAPMVLGRLGILDDKTAVCYPGFEKELTGAKLAKFSKVVNSKNVITAAGMGVAIPFGLAIVEKLRSKQEADKIAKSIIYSNITF